MNTTTAVQQFQFNTTGIRVVTIEGRPWFVAMDVCEVLGTRAKDIRANLDSDEVSTYRLSGTVGREPIVVNESGLYSLVMKSRKPEAARFRKWVTSEVLPAIRMDGSYVIDLPALIRAAHG